MSAPIFFSALLSVVLSGSVQEPVMCVDRAVFEVNHVEGRFTQIVYRERSGELRDWRVLNDNKVLPFFYDNRKWYAEVDIGVETFWIEVLELYETWTDKDPEVIDRKLRPDSFRRKLGNESY